MKQQKVLVVGPSANKRFISFPEINSVLLAVKEGEIVGFNCYKTIKSGEFEGEEMHLYQRSGTMKGTNIPQFKSVVVDPHTDNPRAVGRASVLVYDWIKEIYLPVV